MGCSEWQIRVGVRWSQCANELMGEARRRTVVQLLTCTGVGFGTKAL